MPHFTLFPWIANPFIQGHPCQFLYFQEIFFILHNKKDEPWPGQGKRENIVIKNEKLKLFSQQHSKTKWIAFHKDTNET